jgi:hypothetical protein
MTDVSISFAMLLVCVIQRFRVKSASCSDPIPIHLPSFDSRVSNCTGIREVPECFW